MPKKIKIDFSKSNMTKVVAILISIFATIYFIYQIYMFTHVPYETEVALIHKYTDQINIDGIVLKTEQILDDSVSGIVKYSNMDSSKIVGGTQLATIYQSIDDLKTDKIVKEKQKQLYLLNSLEQKKR